MADPDALAADLAADLMTVADPTAEARMRRLVADAAAELRAAGHVPVEVNQYGSYTSPGYKCEASGDMDTVRIEYKLPEDDLTDPDRMSRNEKYEARLAARDAYAATLRASGWVVEERTVHGNRPILLTVSEAEETGGNPEIAPPTCENR
jgi:hypothetical protein